MAMRRFLTEEWRQLSVFRPIDEPSPASPFRKPVVVHSVTESLKDNPTDERPYKRPRLSVEDRQPSTKTENLLRPYVFDIDQGLGSHGIVATPEICKDMVDQVKLRNTIILLESDTAPKAIIVPALVWAVEQERVPDRTQPKVSLVVVEDSASIPFRSRLFNMWFEGLEKSPPIRISSITGDDKVALRMAWEAAKTSEFMMVSQEDLNTLLEIGALSLVEVVMLIILSLRNTIREDQPIARLLLNHYARIPEQTSPRILTFAWFGGEIGEYGYAQVKTEAIMFSQIFGVLPNTRHAETRKVARPDDIIMWFDPPRPLVNHTALYTCLQPLIGDDPFWTVRLHVAKQVHLDLGFTPSDLIWPRLLVTSEIIPPTTALSPILPKGPPGSKRPSANKSQDWAKARKLNLAAGSFLTYKEERKLARIHRQIVRMNLKKIVLEQKFLVPCTDPSSESFNVSAKFERFISLLRNLDTVAPGFRCIIFASQSYTVHALHDCLRSLSSNSMPRLRLARVLPSDLSAELSLVDSPIHKVQVELDTGTCNTLVVHASLSGNIKLSPVSCIICWDPPNSFIAYGQMRSHLHPQCGHFILLMERNNGQHLNVSRGLSDLPADGRLWLDHLDDDVLTVPPFSVLDRDVFGSADPRSDVADAPYKESIITDPITGARLASIDSAQALYEHASAVLERTGSRAPHELFRMVESSMKDGHYICTVVLPTAGPFISVDGPESMDKVVARRLGAFKACEELFRMQMLRSQYFPRPLLGLDPVRGIAKTDFHTNTNTGSRSSGSLWQHRGITSYPRRSCAFWERTLGSPVQQLYPMIITMRRTSTDGNYQSPNPPHRSLCLLARAPLPSCSPFVVNDIGGARIVSFLRGGAIKLESASLKALYLFTKILYQTMLGKGLSGEFDDIPCLIAPLQQEWEQPKGGDQAHWPFVAMEMHIAWDEVESASRQRELSPCLSTEDLSIAIDDILLWTPQNDLHKVEIPVQVHVDKTPSSKMENTAVEGDYPTLLSYFQATHITFPAVKDLNQPILEVTPQFGIINMLHRAIRLSDTTRRHYRIPEITRVHPIKASVFRTALALPSIFERLDNILLTRELNAALFSHSLDDDSLLVALTPRSAAVPYNYERLEFIGDCFLKTVATLYVLIYEPSAREHRLHTLRTQIIQNETLFHMAVESHIHQYVFSSSFTPKQWRPLGFELAPSQRRSVIEEDGEATTKSTNDLALPNIVEGETTGDVTEVPKSSPIPHQATHELSAKCLADVCEAIIGAAFLSGGFKLGLSTCKALGLAIPLVVRWDDFARLYKPAPVAENYTHSPEMGKRIENLVDFRPSRPQLLSQAFVHSTATHLHEQSYERFEFLGDAVLDLLVTQHIYHKHPEFSPHRLTSLRVTMVSGGALAAMCIDTGLDAFLRHESEDLRRRIGSFKGRIKEAYTREANSATVEQPIGQYWTEVSPPKELADIIEAVLGALLVSEDFRFTGAEAMFAKVMLPFYEKFIHPDTIKEHPSVLLSRQFTASGCHEYQFISKHDSDEYYRGISCHDVLLAEVRESSEYKAALIGSQLALDALSGDPEFFERCCDCQKKKAEAIAEKATRSEEWQRKQSHRREEAVAERLEVDELL